MLQQLKDFYKALSNAEPRPGLHPVPGTTPLTIHAALIPPTLYFVALLFLPPPPPPIVASPLVKVIRTILALAAAFFFFRLSLAYHVPQSIGLTYQLGLVGIYGGTRVLDAFFVSGWWFGHIPRRVAYHHAQRVETPVVEASNPLDLGLLEREREWTNGGVKDPYSHIEAANGDATGVRWAESTVSGVMPRSPMTRSRSKQQQQRMNTADETRAPKATSTTINVSATMSEQMGESSTVETASDLLRKTISGPRPIPVFETAKTEQGWPQCFAERASWALELELSMRGQGFTWTTADVRHTRKTWLPTIENRSHSILVHVLPVQLAAWYVIHTVYTKYLQQTMEDPAFNPFAVHRDRSWSYRLHRPGEIFDDLLPIYVQLVLTVALGGFLMSAFSLGHSIFAIMLHPFGPGPLAFFPPLYTTPVWDITSVRAFWSFGWHRLFARLFLVWGIWPGEWLERKLLGKGADQPADIGKVIGAFASSAFVHAFSVRGVLAGNWSDAGGEMRFFLLNGVAVVIEGAVRISVKMLRRRMGRADKQWYDAYVGRLWWIAAVVWCGREFARGWVKSSLVREMAFR